MPRRAPIHNPMPQLAPVHKPRQVLTLKKANPTGREADPRRTIPLNSATWTTAPQPKARCMRQ